MRAWLRDHGLLIANLLLFVIFFGGMVLSGVSVLAARISCCGSDRFCLGVPAATRVAGVQAGRRSAQRNRHLTLAQAFWRKWVWRNLPPD